MIVLQDIDFNANVKIEDVAPPDRLISGFALEMFGSPLAVSNLLQPFHNDYAVMMHLAGSLTRYVHYKQRMHAPPSGFATSLTCMLCRTAMFCSRMLMSMMASHTTPGE